MDNQLTYFGYLLLSFYSQYLIQSSQTVTIIFPVKLDLTIFLTTPVSLDLVSESLIHDFRYAD